MKLLISIVDYNKAKKVVSVIDRVLESNYYDLDIEFSIVDNSCSLENKQILDSVSSKASMTIIYPEENIGYTKATNLSTKNRTFDYLLIINPDVELEIGFDLGKLLACYENLRDVGVMGIKQLNPDGTLAPVFRRYPSLLAQILRRLPIRRIGFIRNYVAKYEARDCDWSKMQKVDWLQSSFWLVNSNTWFNLNGLDERFFLFMSDPDFCLRANKSGYSCYYNPNFVAHSDGLRCSDGGIFSILTNKPLQWHLLDSIKYYFKVS